MTKDDSRDGKGRFKPGAPGRPKGTKNRRRTYSETEIKARVAVGVDERLQALVGSAVDVIEARLGDGDLKAALWLLDSARGRRTQRLSTILADCDLSTVEGAVAAAERVTDHMLCGELGVGEAAEALANLWRFAQMKGYLRFAELEDILEEIKQQSSDRARMNDHLPMWGKLREAAARHEAEHLASSG